MVPVRLHAGGAFMTPLDALLERLEHVAHLHGSLYHGPLCRDAAAALRRLTEEVAVLTSGGIIETMVRNPNVDSFVREHEARTERAEAEVARLSNTVTETAHAYSECAEWLEEAKLSNTELRAEVERLRGPGSASARDDHPEAICDSCGRRNVVWFTPSCYWNPVARTDAGDPMLCPTCFIQRAESAFPNQAWMVTPEFSDEGPFPDGVRAYYDACTTAAVEAMRERAAKVATTLASRSGGSLVPAACTAIADAIRALPVDGGDALEARLAAVAERVKEELAVKVETNLIVGGYTPGPLYNAGWADACGAGGGLIRNHPLPTASAAPTGPDALAQARREAVEEHTLNAICRETGTLVYPEHKGRCPTHGGDACLVTPYGIRFALADEKRWGIAAALMWAWDKPSWALPTREGSNAYVARGLAALAARPTTDAGKEAT